MVVCAAASAASNSGDTCGGGAAGVGVIVTADGSEAGFSGNGACLTDLPAASLAQ